MTRSKMKRETPEAERGSIARDKIYAYLRKEQPEHAAHIALRMTYRLALIWKIERDERLATNPDDPRLNFHINDQYVHRLHNAASSLPEPSQPEVLAEHHALSLLAEFDPDRAWLTAHNVYKELDWKSGRSLDLRYGPVGWTNQGLAQLSSGDRPQE
jgi:hypothetical protein